MAAVAASASPAAEDEIITQALSNYYLSSVRLEENDPDTVKTHKEILMNLLKNSNINKKYFIRIKGAPRYINSPLEVAIKAVDLELIRYLLNNGAELILNNDEHAINMLINKYFGNNDRTKDEIIRLLAIGLAHLSEKDAAELLERHIKSLKEEYSNNIDYPVTDKEIEHFFRNITPALSFERKIKLTNRTGGVSGGARTRRHRGRSRKAKTRRGKSRKAK